MSEQVEDLKAKIALEEVNRQKKIEALRSLDTKKLIELLPDLEEKLEAALRAEASFRDLNHGYLSSRDQDCAEVKRILAVLTAAGPGEDKKMTAAERDAWLTLQRTENIELSKAIVRQKDVAFQLENYRIEIEMSKKRLENAHKVIGLRTAQIEFLTEH